MEKTLILRFFQRHLNLIPPSPLRSVRIVDMYEYSSRCTIQEAFNLSLRVVVTYIGSFIRDQQHTAQREGQNIEGWIARRQPGWLEVQNGPGPRESNQNNQKEVYSVLKK